MKIGDKIIAINQHELSLLTDGKEYEVIEVSAKNFHIIDDLGYHRGFSIDDFNRCFKPIEFDTFKTPAHYDNTNGSLYLFAEQQGLNAWEFDILKRVVRSRKKGNFIEDLDKTIKVIELYKKEYENTTRKG